MITNPEIARLTALRDDHRNTAQSLEYRLRNLRMEERQRIKEQKKQDKKTASSVAWHEKQSVNNEIHRLRKLLIASMKDCGRSKKEIEDAIRVRLEQVR